MTTTTGTLPATLLGAALAFASAAEAAPDPRTFRDWMAGCDNVGTCAALSLPAENADPVAWLRLERPAGPDGAVRLVLRLRGEWKTPPAALQLKLDAAPFPAGGGAIKATSVDGDLVSITFSQPETAALIEAARKASKLSITAGGATAGISLSGSVAAMLWIDEQQGRLNTTSALVRKGPATAVPPAQPLPVIAARATPPMLDEKAAKRLAADLRKRLKTLDPDLCEDGDATLAEADEAWALDAGGRRLVALGCSRGAYNLSSAFWMVEGGNLASAKPVRLPDGDGKDGNILTNASFDPRTGRLSFFAKGRGIGDCGVVGSDVWTGSDFVRADLSMMGECRGIAPDDWITLYRSTVK